MGRDEIRLVALEIGLGQSDEVVGLLEGAGFGEVERLNDLAGIERGDRRTAMSGSKAQAFEAAIAAGEVVLFPSDHGLRARLRSD